MTEKSKKRFTLIFGATALTVLVGAEIYKKIAGLEEGFDIFYQIFSRILGGLVFIWFIATSDFSRILTPSSKRLFRSLLFSLPCFAVAVNNFPFYSYFAGNASIDAGADKILLLALSCLSVGFFEEIVFRGAIFMIMLESGQKSRRALFWSIIKSSALFGLIHIVNLFFGASPGYVLLQVGYSFLIGGMCAVVLLKTRNLWLCVILHSLYNFSGALVPELGSGEIWEAPTVIITVLISIATAAYILRALSRITPEEAGMLFRDKN